MGLHWDWNINAGNIIAAIVLFAGLIKAHITNVKRMQVLEMKLDLVFEWWRIKANQQK